MPFQLVGIFAGIAAQGAGEGPLPRVRANVAPHLAGLREKGEIYLRLEMYLIKI